MNRISKMAVVTLSTMVVPQLSHAQTAAGPSAGMLVCVVDTQKVAMSDPDQDVVCDFISASDGSQTRYYGTIRDLGIDVAEIDGGHMTWLVRNPASISTIAGAYGASPAAPDLQLPPHAMVLSGEGGTGVVLQPAMLEGYGLNFAVGVKALTLTKS